MNYFTELKNSWVQFSIISFFEKIFLHNVFFFNRAGLSTVPLNLVRLANIFYIFILKLYKKTAKIFNLYIFMMVLFISFFNKDLELLKGFLIEKFKKNTFKKHKKYLTIFRYLLKLVTTVMIKHEFISGYKILISGKIGAAGSTKKKK